MEYCRGGELFDRLLEVGHFTENQAAVIMQQVFREALSCRNAMDKLHCAVLLVFFFLLFLWVSTPSSNLDEDILAHPYCGWTKIRTTLKLRETRVCWYFR